MNWDGAVTLLAPVVAIGMALATRRVLWSLASGALVAGWVAAQGDVADGLGRVVGYVWEAVSSADNLTIATFTVVVAAMVAVMGASGATRLLIAGVERVARGPRGAMVASWLAGFVVFFDDYANCMVVGRSMGPVCDRYGVSRAKLAYIVDSTAAPVASLTLVSTWVGYEVGLLDQALATVGREGQGFELFLTALPYRFYGIFALILVGIIAISGRDFGPMLHAERAARSQAMASDSPEVVPWRRVFGAAGPVLALVVVTFGLMVQTGLQAEGMVWGETPLFVILGEADVYNAMLAGSVVGWLLAVLQGFGARTLTGAAIASSTWEGLHTVGEALAVLFLAWSLGNAVGDTSAQAYLAAQLSGSFPAWLLPTVVFVLAGITAFSTGTSFGTMSILVPLAVPLAVELGGDSTAILSGTTAAVLAGACLGDHASPISDTTVLSAAGAQVDLVTHVRTQLPYALLAGSVAIVLGYLPSALGLHVAVCIALGVAALLAAVYTWGTVAEATDA